MGDKTETQKGVEARQAILDEYGLTEDYITSLRELDPDEARWRIEHEHKVGIAWQERRRDFLLTECARPPRRRRSEPSPHLVSPREGTRRVGSRLA